MKPFILLSYPLVAATSLHVFVRPVFVLKI
jgi:hypothetical protein